MTAAVSATVPQQRQWRIRSVLTAALSALAVLVTATFASPANAADPSLNFVFMNVDPKGFWTKGTTTYHRTSNSREDIWMYLTNGASGGVCLRLVNTYNNDQFAQGCFVSKNDPLVLGRGVPPVNFRIDSYKGDRNGPDNYWSGKIYY